MFGNYQYNPEENYTSPEQYKDRTAYAKALLYGAGQQPVRHWTQGASNMVAALMGGHLMNRAGRDKRSSDMYESDQLTNATNPVMPAQNPNGY